ncbi:MAG: glycoside hydrolase family 44 protein [Armatimonadetes bacterium]|nr:glycoside hydrolase family 44 protein [Armatimonadota bacterium]
MAKRVSTSVSKARRSWKPPILALAVLVLVAAGVGHQAVRGHGHWHALAASVYHRWRDWREQNVHAAPIPLERADAPLLIYAGQLGDGWQDWSWASHTLGNHGPITMTPEGFKGVFLHHDTLGTGGYGALLVVARNVGKVNVVIADGGGKFLEHVPLQKYGSPARIPLAVLGVPKRGGAISGVVFQAATREAQPPVMIDQVALLPDLSLPPAPTRATVSVTVDVGADRHPISPLIYGMAFAPPDYLQDLRLGVNRWGGNDKSRYDWVQGNACNAAADWGFRNRAASDGAIPPGPSSAADAFVRQNRAAGAATLLTVPTLGWVARDADNNHASQNVPGSGGPPLAGPDGPIAGYDPTDNRIRTSVRSVARKNAPFTDAPTLAGGVVYQDEWIHHLVGAFGDAAAGGVRLYAMDNEPDLWDTTHRDVHPARMGYDDFLKTFLDYAAAVKDVDRAALITGPVSWGWTGFVYSPLDRGDDNFHTHADQDAHGGEWFLPWFLHQVRDHDAKAGRRTLDVLDVHYYPQGQGVYGAQDDQDTRARRLRATRSLWDPTYADESWIAEPLRLIPRLREWVARDYPGTKIGLTEWSFGADTQMDGGLADADALGIFGREGVFLANYWAWPAKNGPAYLAFKLFRNADGQGHGFGNLSCRAVSADPGRLACYAATEGGDLTLMLINKMPKATVTVPLALRGLPPAARAVKMWRVSADNPGRVAALPPQTLPGAAASLRLPPYSMTLLRVPVAAKGGAR